MLLERDTCVICHMPIFIESDSNLVDTTRIITLSCVMHDHIKWTYIISYSIKLVALKAQGGVKP